MGTETEYSFSIQNGLCDDHDAALRQLLRIAARKYPFLHECEEGGRLFFGNASALALDCHHPETQTPETQDPAEAVRYDRASRQILAECVAEMPGVTAHCGQVQYHTLQELTTGTYGDAPVAWGHHQSFQHRIEPALLRRHIPTFLASRVIFGAGGFVYDRKGISFTVSPRAWCLEHESSSSSTNDRGLFHTKDEALCGHGYHRLHVLSHEAVCSDLALYLALGGLALAIHLQEASISLPWRRKLRSPLQAMQRWSLDPTLRTTVKDRNDRDVTAIDIQRFYMDLASKNLDKLPAWAPGFIHTWASAIDRLTGAPDAVNTSFDWAIKLAIFQDHATARFALNWFEIIYWNELLEIMCARMPSEDPEHCQLTARRLERRLGLGADWKERVRVKEGAGIPEGEPVPRKLNPDLTMRDFIKLRSELFEIDYRFSELGPAGIYGQLSAAGLLNDQVDGVERIAEAVLIPPSRGRAAIRGRLVQEYASSDGRSPVLVSWNRASDLQSDRYMDLSDPFAESAEWTDPRASLWKARNCVLYYYYSGDFACVRAEVALLRQEFIVRRMMVRDNSSRRLAAFTLRMNHLLELHRGETSEFRTLLVRRMARGMEHLLPRGNICQLIMRLCVFRWSDLACGAGSDLSDATELIERAVKAAEERSDLESDDRSEIFEHCAALRLAHHAPDESLPLCERSLAFAESMHPAQVVRVLAVLAETYRRMNRTAEAMETIETAEASPTLQGTDRLDPELLLVKARLETDRSRRNELLKNVRQFYTPAMFPAGWVRAVLIELFGSGIDSGGPWPSLRQLALTVSPLKTCPVLTSVLRNKSAWAGGDADASHGLIHYL
jgi:hypothetical protein